MYVIHIPTFNLEAVKNHINQGSVTSPFSSNLENDTTCTFGSDLCEVIVLGVKVAFATYYTGSAYHLIHGEPTGKIAHAFEFLEKGKSVKLSAYCQEITIEPSIVEATYFKVINESKFVVSIVDETSGFQQHLLVSIDKDEIAISILNHP
jgi:hypothetical protein